MNSLWKRYGLFGLLTALAVGLDQWTKRLAVENLMGNGPFVIWDGVFELLYSENRGAAFGILQGKHAFFFLVAAAVIVVVLLFLYRMPWSRRYMPLYFSMVAPDLRGRGKYDRPGRPGICGGLPLFQSH